MVVAVYWKINKCNSKEEISEIAFELSPDYAKCIEDQNGNHVIQKLIEKLNDEERKKLFDVIYPDKVNEFCVQYYVCSWFKQYLILVLKMNTKNWYKK